ncbi:hypothetical protein FJY69_04885 [candidate division WOR-3 bacterium]|nr:hypothetical protein [candidate division WOR-3 bacterium]
MRLVTALVPLYLLCLTQVAVGPMFPQLALVLVVVLSWGQDSASSGGRRLAATLLGAFVGLCLDLSAPGSAGLNLLVLALSGYAAASLKLVIYRGRWALLLICLAALVARWFLLALDGSPAANPGPVVVSSGLTLLLTYLVAQLLVPSR